ncbi:SDR family oxidoreductase [Chelativorans sp.]|uniref:SDR family NAD(P)-dependent oxidoreductase n=1 Tax=Chelativorans sp. TaxID=2203393 RepID=UPI002811241A|nr:SDR family oxidoreductase [Chelativorans sp.]
MQQGIERVVVVTGAASGIGAAIARQLAAPGTALMLHTRLNEAGLSALAQECAAKGAATATFLGDLADPEIPARLVEAARQGFGRVDQIVSNAGQAQQNRFGTLTDEDLQNAFETMPFAFFRLVDAALPDLEKSDWGRVLAISSFVAHLFGTNGLHFPASSAAKAALEALAKSLAAQLAPLGVTVNCIAPGFTRKDAAGHAATSRKTMESAAELTPTGRLAEPADIAAAAAFLLAREARQITGQVVHVDGGLMLA